MNWFEEMHLVYDIDLDTYVPLILIKDNQGNLIERKFNIDIQSIDDLTDIDIFVNPLGKKFKLVEIKDKK